MLFEICGNLIQESADNELKSQKNLYEQGAFGGGGANGGGEGVVEGEYVEVDDCHCVKISMRLGKGFNKNGLLTQGGGGVIVGILKLYIMGFRGVKNFLKKDYIP